MGSRWHTFSLCLWKHKLLYHNLISESGGYISMRHNSVRDSETQTMREAYQDAQIEPTLPQLTENMFEKIISTSDNARLDISSGL